MIKTLISFSLIIGAIYLSIAALMYFNQHNLLYMPTPARHLPPEQRLWLETPDARLALLVDIQQRPRAMIYWGGNAEEVAFNLSHFQGVFQDTDLYLVYYRGYGESSGKPEEQALLTDALAVFDHISAQPNAPEISLVGRSLGSGIATYVASQRNVAQLVLITPYDSILNIARSHYPIFPVKWLLKDKFESWRYAASVTAPTRLIVAERDEVIPLTRSQRLYKAFLPQVREWVLLDDVGHNTIQQHPQFYSHLSRPPD